MRKNRVVAAVLALVLLLSLCACGGQGEKTPPKETPAVSAAPTPAASAAPQGSQPPAEKYPEAGQFAAVAEQLQGDWEMISGDMSAYIIPERYGLECSLWVEGNTAQLRWRLPEEEQVWADIPITWYADRTVWEGYVYNFMFGLEPEGETGPGFYGWMEGDTLHLFSWSWPVWEDMGAVYLRHVDRPERPVLEVQTRELKDDTVDGVDFRASVDEVTLKAGGSPSLKTTLEDNNDSCVQTVLSMEGARILEYEANGLTPEPDLRCHAEIMRSDERFVSVLYTYQYEWNWHAFERHETLNLSTPTGWRLTLEELVDDTEAVLNAIRYQLEQDPDREFFDADWRDIVTLYGLGGLPWYLAENELHVFYDVGMFTSENFPYAVEVTVPMGDDGHLLEYFPPVPVG